MVPLYNIEARRVVALGSDADYFPLNVSVVDLADAATATPLYYPPVKVEVPGSKKDTKPLWFIDGSVVSSDPSLLALSSARKKWGEKEEYRILSLGCGQKSRPINGEEAATYGGLDWLQHDLLGIAMDGGHLASHLSDILGSSYLRVDGELAPSNDDLDELSPHNIEQLRKLGKDLYTKHKAALVKFFEPPKPKVKEEESLKKSSSKSSLKKLKEEEEAKRKREEEAAKKKKEEEELARKKAEEEEAAKKIKEEAAKKKKEEAAAAKKKKEEEEEARKKAEEEEKKHLAKSEDEGSDEETKEEDEGDEEEEEEDEEEEDEEEEVEVELQTVRPKKNGQGEDESASEDSEEEKKNPPSEETKKKIRKEGEEEDEGEEDESCVIS